MRAILIYLFCFLVFFGAPEAPRARGLCPPPLPVAEAVSPEPIDPPEWMIRLFPWIFPPVEARPVTVYMDVAAQIEDLCARKPKAVLCSGAAGSRLLTPDEVIAIDREVRNNFEYMNDDARWGPLEYWTVDQTCGDCEDYALRVAERLHRAGQPGADMGLIMWMPEGAPAGHATLVVATTDGYYELGVEREGTPKPITWDRPHRGAVMWMDGKRKLDLVPGSTSTVEIVGQVFYLTFIP